LIRSSTQARARDQASIAAAGPVVGRDQVVGVGVAALPAQSQGQLRGVELRRRRSPMMGGVEVLAAFTSPAHDHTGATGIIVG